MYSLAHEIRSNFLHYGCLHKPIHCMCHIKTLGALIIIMIIILNDSFFSSLPIRVGHCFCLILFPFHQMDGWLVGWFVVLLFPVSFNIDRCEGSDHLWHYTQHVNNESFL